MLVMPAGATQVVLPATELVTDWALVALEIVNGVFVDVAALYELSAATDAITA